MMNDFLDIPTRQLRTRSAKSVTPLDPDSFAFRARFAMVATGTNVSDVARAIGRSRVVTSQAINHGLHEPTRRLVAQHLNIAA